jgi:hypothetical protein
MTTQTKVAIVLFGCFGCACALLFVAFFIDGLTAFFDDTLSAAKRQPPIGEVPGAASRRPHPVAAAAPAPPASQAAPNSSSPRAPVVRKKDVKAATVKPNRLQQFARSMTIGETPLISHYSVTNGSAYIHLNPAIWNALSASEQRQLCDRLANVDVWDQMQLVNAWLYVHDTEIGRIAPTFFGRGRVFKPALRSLE